MKIALIDSDFIIYTICHGEKVLDESGQPIKKDNKFVYTEKSLNKILQQVDEFIINILNKTESTHYLLFLTVTRGFRYNINSEYKANRKDLVKPKWFKVVREYLIEKWGAKYHNDYEADDLVLTYSKIFSASIIISNDKDLLYNIEGTHYNPKKQEFITTTKESAYKTFWSSLIIGDVADGISGLKNKGEVFVNKKFENKLSENYPSIVLKEYIIHFGEEEGVEEFYKNYKSLKIKNNIVVEWEPVEYIPLEIKTIEYNNLNF